MHSPSVIPVSPAGQLGPRRLVDLCRAHAAQARGLLSPQEVIHFGPHRFAQALEVLTAAHPESRPPGLRRPLSSRAGGHRPGQVGEGAARLELGSEGCVQVLKHAVVDYKKRERERAGEGRAWGLPSPWLPAFSLDHTHSSVTPRGSGNSRERASKDTLEPSNPIVLMGCGTRNSSSASPWLISDEL